VKEDAGLEQGLALARQLRCTGGEIYASVLENRSTGVPRGLYWNIYLEGAAVVLDDEDRDDDKIDESDEGESDDEDREAGQEEWDTAFLCDSATWPIRAWIGLDGMSLESLVDPGRLQTSFYLGEHHDAKARLLDLRHSEGARFHVRLEGEFTLEGFGALDAAPIAFEIEGEVDFAGVYVIPNNLSPKPVTPAEAKACVAELLDVSTLEEPVWDRFRFVLAPIA
jgi:hypothetical protein